MRMMSLLLSMLAMTVPMTSPAQAPATSLEPAESTVFLVDSDASWLRVLATPDGPLRRFGHYHVISHHGISGMVEVAPDPLDSSLALEISVADFAVDDPAMRELEGEDFEKEVSQKDIDGTKANMLGEKLLHAEQFPSIQVRSGTIEGSLPDVNIVTNVMVKGIELSVTFPASIELTDTAFVARGEREITHAELGLSPFTAMGGALSVGDLLVLKYEISGVRVVESE